MKPILQDTVSQPDSITTNRADFSLGNLYEPPPLTFHFETIGWTILAGLFLFGLLILTFFLVRKYIKNRYRREALNALKNISDQQVLNAVWIILKRVAIQAFGREKVGNLYGKEWLQFLEKTGKNVEMVKYESQLAASLYRGENQDISSTDEILLNVKKWIKTHARQL